MCQCTLVIHAPYWKGKPGSPYSFETYLKKSWGKGYAIYQKDVSKLPAGSKVILLRNDKNKRRAEGVLVKLDPTGEKTPQGIQRYDVYIKNLKEVLPYNYKPEEKLNRCGVAVFCSNC